MQGLSVSPAPDKPLGVGCRGRIEPEDGVILIAAPYFGGRPSLISELRTKESDWVKAGQILAVLDGWQSLEKAVRQSEADVEVARKRLALHRKYRPFVDAKLRRCEIPGDRVFVGYDAKIGIGRFSGLFVDRSR